VTLIPYGTEILRFQYDPNNRMTNRWSKQKGNTVYAYDAVANSTAVTYPVSPSITYQYDALDRLTNVLDAIGPTVYGYTAASLLQSEDGPWSNDTVTYGYSNRLRSSLSIQAPNSSTWTQTYVFDAARRLSTLSSAAGAFNYAYNPTRNLQVGKLTLPNSAHITNTYDSVSRLLSTVLKSSTNVALNSHAYGYDLAGRRTWLTNMMGDYRNFTYDNLGQLRSANAYEASGTPRAQEQLEYTYDPAGNLSWRTNNGLAQSFGLNSLNEISSASASGTLTVAGTTTSPATNVTVWGTSLSSGSAALYADSTWARTNVTLPNGSASYYAYPRTVWAGATPPRSA